MALISDPPAGADRAGIQVLSRAAALLRALQRHPDGMSLGPLALAVQLPRSTVQRLVNALHREGLVISASGPHTVRLGPSLLALAAAARLHVAEAERATLEALARECGETVDLSMPDQDQVVFVDQIPSSHRLMALSAVGVSFNLHSSANGKALLAAMDDAEIARLRTRLKLTAETPNTITSWERLDAEIDGIRRSGVAYDREENAIGISAVAAAVRGPYGDIAAISIPVPTQRFEAAHDELAAALRKYVGRLQRRLEP